MAHHPVEVIRIDSLEKHPNADTLSVVKVKGFTCCVRTSDWNVGDLAAYVEPDSMVNGHRPEFAFLKDPKSSKVEVRIRVKKLRGIISMGLLIKAPEGAKVGDDVGEGLGVVHYEPPISTTGGEAESPPKGHYPVYDVENWRRYQHIIKTGEPVQITEKIHGANGRFTFDKEAGRFRCGSRTEWKRPQDPCHEGGLTGCTKPILWWTALESSPSLRAMLEKRPDLCAYGEVYGQVQNLKYGRKDVQVVIFDLWLKTEARWLNDAEFAEVVGTHGLSTVPVVYEGPCPAPEDLEKMAEGLSLIPGAGHIREGIVIKPQQERQDPEIGRVILKIVSSTYLEKS